MTTESQELELARRQLREQRRELEALAERLSQLEGALDAERRRADRYIDQLRALRGSISWRVTRPLRTRRSRQLADADA